MKKIFAFTLIMVLVVVSLVACFGGKGEPENPCKDGHTFTTYASNDDATCTADGTKTAKCDNCDVTDTKLDSGSKKDHAFGEWVETKIANCTDKGAKKRICSVCKNEEKTETPAVGHTFNTEVYAYQSEDGHAHKCTVCGAQDSNVQAHTPGALATETEAQKCTVCQYVIAAPLGHTQHAFTLEVKNEVTFKSGATCTSPAIYYKSCSCGTVSTTEIFTQGEAFGHDFIGATCIDPKTCKRCSETEGEALGHDFGDWYIYLDATASAKGERRRDCKNCAHYDSEPIPAKESNMDPDGWTPVR